MYQPKCSIRSQNYQNVVGFANRYKTEIQWWVQKVKDWNQKQILTIETAASKEGWVILPIALDKNGGGGGDIEDIAIKPGTTFMYI